MGRFLMIDVGAGTMDILYYDSDTGTQYKAVVASPVRAVPEKVSGLAGDILVTGVEMGGGALAGVLKDRTRHGNVVMTASAARTIHHDLDKVRSWGIRVIEDDEAMDVRSGGGYREMVLGDIEEERIRGIVEGFGVPFSFDAVGACAQDHGVPPPGVSHLDFRHNIFQEELDKNPYPHTLVYESDRVPEVFNRLKAMARAAEALPTKEAYVMDSGMAAILGASLDPRVQATKKALVLDIATSHTVGAALEGQALAGFFEYHTHDITVERLDGLLKGLADGKLEPRRILEEGGHGAYLRKALGFKNIEIILATGPKRRLVGKSGLPIVPGAPFGDNMMTGTAGLLEAIRRCKGLEPFDIY